jgi:hypothetical protein
MSLGRRSPRFAGLVGHRAQRTLAWLAGAALSVIVVGSAPHSSTSAAGLLPYTPKSSIPALTARTTTHLVHPAVAQTLGFVSIAGNKAVRWDQTLEAPIRVRVEDAPTLEGWSAADTAIVKGAFEAWERDGIPVRFVLDSSAGADVVVHWVDRFSGPMSGWTTVNWDDLGDIHHGDVRLALNTPTGRRLTPSERLLLATHEFGHVLGLGHTTDTSSVMSAVIYAHDIGQVDIQSVRRLYDFAVASR